MPPLSYQTPETTAPEAGASLGISGCQVEPRRDLVSQKETSQSPDNWSPNNDGSVMAETAPAGPTSLASSCPLSLNLSGP